MILKVKVGFPMNCNYEYTKTLIRDFLGPKTTIPSKKAITDFSKNITSKTTLKHTQILNLIAKELGYKKFNDLKPVIVKKDLERTKELFEKSILFSSLPVVNFNELFHYLFALTVLGRHKKNCGEIIISKEFAKASFKRFKHLLPKETNIDNSITLNDAIEAVKYSTWSKTEDMDNNSKNIFLISPGIIEVDNKIILKLSEVASELFNCWLARKI
jgi:hypothetical protein